MTVYLFPDNTVLCNFAAVDRLDLLEKVLNGRGRWTEAVAFEASRSARAHPPLLGISKQDWLGDPVAVTAEEDVRRIQRVRRTVFGGTEDKPLQHLGEAETCFVITEWTEFAGSWWISDDRDALRYARARGIVVRETMDLLSEAVAGGDIDAASAFALAQKMADEGRSLRLPRSAEELRR